TDFEAKTLRRFAYTRRFVAQCLQQTQYSVATGSNAEQNRANDTVAQFLSKIIENLITGRLDVFEQLLHQLVVVIGQRLQHREARFLLAIEIFALEFDDLRRCAFLVDIGAFEREVDEARNNIAVPDWDLPQQ